MTNSQRCIKALTAASSVLHTYRAAQTLKTVAAAAFIGYAAVRTVTAVYSIVKE